MKMRISQFPKAQKCRACPSEEAKIVRAGNDFTASGQAWHKVAHNYIANVPNNPELLAAYYGVELSDVIEAIDKLAFVADFDASKIPAGTLMVWDYKSGFGEVEPPQRNTQLIGYAGGAMQYLCQDRPWDLIDADDRPAKSGFKAESPVYLRSATGHPDLFAWNLDDNNEITRIELIIIYPRRDGWTEKAVFDRKTFDQWEGALIQIIEECTRPNPEYRVGEHCAKCDARLTCPALNKAVALFDSGAPAVFSQSSPEIKGRMFDVAKAVAKVAGDIVELAKAEVDAGRDVVFADGTVLTRIEKPTRKVDAVDGWQIVKDYAECLTVSTTRLESEYTAANVERTESGRAKKGENDRVKKELWAKLEAAGAVTREPRVEYRAMLPVSIEQIKEFVA